ncbi:MAG: glycoside hydrolase family 38 C-terminal domain-containing protein [Meiothermus sp.]|uniref:alpha-mannosidase n=1 Tax=Meiothermus sp. TaxID=1955249 RepID=UPI0025F34C9C|nr:glycoside hydrolase family 38 C-terminal domain-containing protein [Meiothermus sp.]MCS7068372.1 glycosyl hydrolase-related protein [Meiothermus sp.]MDW8424823.1 glycoside hydrolase family 38 C-terminal domain-containing protein [Meiothermus sp.]
MQALKRLWVRWQELSAWRDLETRPLAGMFEAAGGPRVPIAVGEPWPDRSFPVRFFFELEVPTAWAGKPVWVRLKPGGEGLLCAGGRPLGGLNPYHTEYPLWEPAKGGERLELEVEAVPKGLFGSPVAAPKLEEALLLVPDLQVRSLCQELACVLEAVPQVQPELAALLLDALSETLARIELPRGPAREYLNQLERAWAAETAKLWEEWRFEGPGLPLQAPHRQSLEEARRHLQEALESIRRRHPARGRLWLSGHAHIDLAWLWPIGETRRKLRRTFATVLHLMERYPAFYFNQSSAQAYAWLEADDPALFAQVRSRVQEGRWEPVGGMWVEPDANLLSGESWARQLLYGQRYFEQKLGRRARVAWLPDTFGFAANLPQFLQQGGLPYFFTTKLNWNETNPFPHDLWQWEGLDGSRVLAHSFWNPGEGYNGRLEALELAGTWKNFKGQRLHPTSLLTFGYGNGGGGPSAEMMERFAVYREFPGLPRLEMGRVEDFYRALEAASPNLPVWVGELYLELHRATYTTQARLKALCGRLEQTLREAELAWSLVSLKPVDPRLTIDEPRYPAHDLESFWKVLLLHQFHDILPGSAIHSVPQEAAESLQTALIQAEELRQEALGLLSSEVRKVHPEALAHLVVWNLSSSPRPLRLQMERPAERFFRLLTASGDEVPYQEAGAQILVAADEVVPAMGYLALAVVAHLEARRTPNVRVNGQGRVLENQHLRLEVAPDGTLARLYDKDHRREVLAGRGNQIWAYTDIPRYWEAWDLDASYEREGREVTASQVRLIEGGPLRAGIWVERRLGASSLEQTYWLWGGSRRLEIETRIRWQERRTLLRALFPLNLRTHEAWFETAFGALARPNHANTTWDEARFEVPALRWADLSEAGYGVSLLGGYKHGYSAHHNQLGLSLLRGPLWPDPLADVGEHAFTYALWPHPGDWRQGTVAEAEDLVAPLRPLALPVQAGGQPPVRPFLRLSPSSLRVAALKQAEEGAGYILRLYEAHGGRGVVELDLNALGVRRVSRVNLLEEAGEPLPLQNGHLKLAYAPYQVISLRLEP